jgi:hypothetical protein
MPIVLTPPGDCSSRMLPGLDIFNTRSDGLHHIEDFVSWDPEQGWQAHVRIIRPVSRGQQVFRQYGLGQHNNVNLLVTYGFTERPLRFTSPCSAAASAPILPSYEFTMVCLKGCRCGCVTLFRWCTRSCAHAVAFWDSWLCVESFCAKVSHAIADKRSDDNRTSGPTPFNGQTIAFVVNLCASTAFATPTFESDPQP